MSTVTPLPQRPAPRSLGEVVSRAVRLLMAEHEVNQTALALVLGVTQTQVSARLRGKAQWSLDDLARLAAYFGRHGRRAGRRVGRLRAAWWW